MAGEPRRIEPWPVAVVLALVVLIGVCLSLWAIAAHHRDVEVEQGRPGLLIPGEEHERRG